MTKSLSHLPICRIRSQGARRDPARRPWKWRPTGTAGARRSPGIREEPGGRSARSRPLRKRRSFDGAPGCGSERLRNRTGQALWHRRTWAASTVAFGTALRSAGQSPGLVVNLLTANGETGGPVSTRNRRPVPADIESALPRPIPDRRRFRALEHQRFLLRIDGVCPPARRDRDTPSPAAETPGTASTSAREAYHSSPQFERVKKSGDTTNSSSFPRKSV